MKCQLFKIGIIASFSLFILGACVEKQSVVEIPFKNPDIRTDTLRVLAIGNSFTVDGTDYIQYLVNEADLDKKRFCIYTLTEGGTSLAHWLKYIKSDNEYVTKRLTGDIIMPTDRGTVRDIVAQNWDVVVVQELSNYSDNFERIEPDLKNLMDQITKICVNPQVALAWQMTWSYWSDYSVSHPCGENGWKSIEETVEMISEHTGINHIIPVGTAIQNARSSVLNSEYDLTRDGKHLGYGVGKYVAACTWFEYFFTPMFGMSVEGNPLRWETTDYEKEHSLYTVVDVTDDNAILCHKCAVNAIMNRDILTLLD